MTKQKEAVLSVKNLSVSFYDSKNNQLNAVNDVSFDLYNGSSLGIVGESGCGKSVTNLSIMRLLPQPHAKITSGQILLKDKNNDSSTNYTDILKLPRKSLSMYRGKRIAMIFQNPMTSLNPVHKVGKQIIEAITIHFPNLTKQQKTSRCVDLLDSVGIPEAKKRMNDFPHQLSGGMRQRVVIAIALACEPDILIADEPTTALDVTIQAQILDLIKQIKKSNNMSVILITHDMGVISENTDQLVVMYAGKIVEHGLTKQILSEPKHPYTKGLLKSMPCLSLKPKTFLPIIPGMVPSIYDMPSGCRFQGRCELKEDICQKQPPLYTLENNRLVACHKYS